MNELLQKNLKELNKRDPELASRLEKWSVSPAVRIVNSQKGLPVIKAGNITLHSLVDPEREAKEWMGRAEVREVLKGQQAVGVLGFGTGYHIKALLQIEGLSLTIFEPSLDIVRLALEVMDFSASLPRLSWVVDIERTSGIRRLSILRHQPSLRFHKTSYPLWLEIFNPSETMGDLKRAFSKDAAISDFLAHFPPDAPADLGVLTEKIRQGTGPISEWQTMFLLMEEFQKEGSKGARGQGAKGK